MTAADPNAEQVPINLERYRLRLGFWQAVWGTLISGGVAVAIPAAVDAYKARLDLRKAEQEVALKQKEIESKAQDLHQTYISKFIDTALNQDIELRLRFSEYFSYVSDKDSRDQWKLYHDGLERRRDAIRSSINDKETRAARLGAISKPSEADQVEISALRRELEWNYAEVGYARRDTNISVPSPSTATSRDPKTIKSENDQLFEQAVVDPQRVSQLEKLAERLKGDKEKYLVIESKTGVPWYIVAWAHERCCSGDFTRHLNGDPLSDRTTNVPRGRPGQGSPPFSWEESAVDMLGAFGWTNSDWSSVGTILYRLEAVDGFGYRSHNVRSPAIWACTNLYVSGKFVSQGIYDPNTKESRCGAGALLKILVQRKLVDSPQ